MENWDELIHTAMIGTGKKNSGPDTILAGLSMVSSVIGNNAAIDQEEKFIQLAALCMNYRRAGMSVLKKEGISMPVAPAEEKQLCTPGAMQVLQDILLEESMPLLALWLQACARKQQIVGPGVVPVLFAIAGQQKILQTLIGQCCGKRGEWLSQFNPAWNFQISELPEQIWLTGTSEQRKLVLKDTRRQQPALAREWLKQSWLQEDAASRTAFIEILRDQLGEEDLDFLQNVLTDKSKKVKEAVQELLKSIPASPVVRQYEAILKSAVTLKTEKSLLGMLRKTTLHFQLPVLEEGLFMTGIDKLSSTKEISDDEFIIYQLICFVPPSFWETHFDATPEQIILYFQKDAVGKKMIPALVESVGRFHNRDWALALDNEFYPGLIPLLTGEGQNHYFHKFFDQHAAEVIQHAVTQQQEWSLELTRKIFQHLAKNPYNYYRSFYNVNISRIPVPISAEIAKFTPPEQNLKNMWEETSAYIGKLLQLKKQTFNAFHS